MNDIIIICIRYNRDPPNIIEIIKDRVGIAGKIAGQIEQI